VKKSFIFVGNDLGRLGNIEHLPTDEEVALFKADNQDVKVFSENNQTEELYKKAKWFLEQDDVLAAWKTILSK